MVIESECDANPRTLHDAEAGGVNGG